MSGWGGWSAGACLAFPAGFSNAAGIRGGVSANGPPCRHSPFGIGTVNRMNAARQQILESLRRARPPAERLPELRGAWHRYANASEQFADVVQSVGGECHFVPDLAALERLARQHVVDSNADITRCASVVSGLPVGEGVLTSESSREELERMAWVFAPGRFAVAENGAVWIDGGDLPCRAALFLCRHLGLVVGAADIVHNMHEAYDRLSWNGAQRGPEFGLFLSGPSKTADIEQSLVIGAQGAKTLHVFVVRPSADDPA